MAGTLTITTTDTTLGRIGVTLAGFTATGSISVYRVHSGDQRHAVRGPITISGGSAFVWDYEAPWLETVTYEASDSGTLVQSAPATLVGTTAWLRAPGLPSYDIQVELIAKPVVRRARPASVLRPLGRASAVVLTDTLKSSEFDLRIRTYGYAQADALEDLVEAAPTALLVSPGARNPWQYVSLLSLDERPLADFIAAVPSSQEDPGGISEWSLSVVVTDSPVGDIYGDPTASYQATKDAYALYQDFRTAKATYLLALQGV